MSCLLVAVGFFELGVHSDWRRSFAMVLLGCLAWVRVTGLSRTSKGFGETKDCEFRGGIWFVVKTSCLLVVWESFEKGYALGSGAMI
jgi:hypothetical protein